MVKSIPIVLSPLLFLSSLRTGSSLRHFVENFGAASRQSWPEHQNFLELTKVSLLVGHSPQYTTLLPTDGCWGIEPHSFPHIIQSRFSSLFLEGVRVMFAVVWLLQSHLCFHRYLMCGPYLGVLRNDTKNGCKADYTPPSICIFWVFVKSYFSTIQIGHLS